MGFFGKNKNEEIEEKEPEQECAFQENWNSEEGFACSLKQDGANDMSCDKSICPFWKEK